MRSAGAEAMTTYRVQQEVHNAHHPNIEPLPCLVSGLIGSILIASSEVKVVTGLSDGGTVKAEPSRNRMR